MDFNRKMKAPVEGTSPNTLVPITLVHSKNLASPLDNFQLP